MSADYILKHLCQARKAIPEAKLVALVGHRSLAEYAVAQIRAGNPTIPLETIKQYQVIAKQSRPDGVIEQRPITVEELFNLAQPLKQFQNDCDKCPANIADRAFGCFGTINYPIRREVEEWLLARLPKDINDPNLQALMRFLSNFEVDGQAIDQMRPKLFESQQALKRIWGSAADLKRITSSQLIHILIFGGNINPKLAGLLAKLLKLNTVLMEKHPTSANIEQFKTLMCGIVMAAKLDVELSIES